MTAEKAEFRAAVVHEMGTKFDEFLDASNAAVHRAEGAEAALGQAAAVVEQLHRHIDAEVDAGSMDLEQSTTVKRWITRAVAALRQLEENAALTQTAQRGHAQGVAFCVKYLKKQHDTELANAESSMREVRGSGDQFRSIKEERLSTPPASVSPPANGESLHHGPNA